MTHPRAVALQQTFLRSLLGLCAALTGCTEARAPRTTAPRLVLLYMPCTVNRRLLSPYDPSVAFTPALDDFAAQSMVFERHITEAGQSGVAYASIFSGGQATLHGVYAHPRHVPRALHTLPEAFRDGGYETFFWGGQRMALASLDGQGLEPRNVFEEGLGAGDAVFGGILERLASEPDYRALVMTSFTVSHAPYKPIALERFCVDYPGECAATLEQVGDRLEELNALYQQNYMELSYDWERTVARLELSAADQQRLRSLTNLLYRSRIRKLDAGFGRILQDIDQAGLRDEALVVFTADHGEVMDRENALFRWTHGHALAPEVLGVPLLIRAPGQGVAPGRYEQVTRSMDLLPTLASLCDLDLHAEPQPQGVDLAAALRGAERPQLLGFAHTSLIPHGAGPDAFGPVFESLYPRDDPALMWVAVHDAQRVYKLRNAGDEVFVYEVFDHTTDPAETTDLYDPSDPVQRDMLARLEAYKASLIADHSTRAQAADPDLDLTEDEQLEALKSLGYVR